MAQAKTVTVENAKIILRNFAGAESQYNRAGDRNFGLLLPDDVAVQMEQDGWNVKWFDPREDGEKPDPWIQVAVSYKNRPPMVTMITSVNRTLLNEDTIAALDYADLANIDLIIRGYEWEVQDKSGIKAYLQTMFVTIEEDELQRKYALMEQDNFNE